MRDSSENSDDLGNVDKEAIALLFAQHREPLRRMIAFRLDPRLARRVDPSDVLQQAFIEALKRVGHFKQSQQTAFRWLRSITEQTMVDILRRHMLAQRRDARREVSIASPATSACIVSHLVGRLSSPSQHVLRAELRATLEEAIQGMDPIDREILALRHFEELGNKEIANLLGIQPTAAYNRYFRALERLRATLASIPGFNEDMQ